MEKGNGRADLSKPLIESEKVAAGGVVGDEISADE